MTTHPERDWQPERTWVVIIGTLEWKHEDVFEAFPKEKRRDAALARFFKQVGVPEDQIAYLRDREATLSRIQSTVASHLHRSRPGDLLFFYYCGHGYLLDSGDACFASYDAGGDEIPDWQAASIPPLIERHFNGDRAILAVDCCYSGCLAEIVKQRNGPLAYACLTSSSASELSTGNWTFTEGLLAALRGQAFTDSDSSLTITLQEMANQILGDMAFAEEQLASFATSGPFDPRMVLAPARAKPHPDVGRRVEVKSEGDWYKALIINARGDRRKVHYYGWEDTDDEWVTPERIRDVTPVRYSTGSAVEVRWKGDWYAARVLAQRGGVHYIQYDGEGEEWNEWVASRRIRPRS